MPDAADDAASNTHTRNVHTPMKNVESWLIQKRGTAFKEPGKGDVVAPPLQSSDPRINPLNPLLQLFLVPIKPWGRKHEANRPHPKS